MFLHHYIIDKVKLDISHTNLIDDGSTYSVSSWFDSYIDFEDQWLQVTTDLIHLMRIKTMTVGLLSYGIFKIKLQW
jgi:hypothetical protein